MNIVNGKFTFDEVPCWECKGTKITTRYTPCPNTNKDVRKLAVKVKGCCPCGATRKHNHQTVGSYEIPCPMCNATGVLMENMYSHITDEQWAELQKHFKINVVHVNRGANFNESYLGLGYLYGCTDYGRFMATKPTDQQILEYVLVDGRPGQPIGWCKKDGTVPAELDIVVRNDGYGVWPKWPKA